MFKMKQATFRIVRYPKLNRYIAMAWNYEQAVLMATTDYDTYTNAREALDELAKERKVELKWFDGEYDINSDGQLIPRLFEEIMA